MSMAIFFLCVMVLTAVVYAYVGGRRSDELRSGLKWMQAAMESGDRDFLVQAGEIREMRVTWMDASGNVMYDSAADPETMSNHAARPEVQKALSGGYGESVRFSDTLRQRTFNCAVRLQDGTVLRVSGIQYTVGTIILSMFTQIVVLLVLAIVLAAVMSAQVSRMVLEPINRLNLTEADERDVYPELRPLVQRINRQSRQIQGQMTTLQRAHEKQDRMRREFTANVSHELKTPLTTISGSAEILQAGLVKAEDVPRFAGHIYNEAQRMISLVNDILRLSQLDQQEEIPHRERVELYGLCAEQIARLRPLAARNRVRLIQQGEPAWVCGVPGMLEEIIYNLCDNAVKYNREDGLVTVTTKADAEGVRLTVTDTGIGIPQQEQARIFERFYRVDKSHSRAMGGTGLGLSIVKHAVQLHQATIHIDSRLHHGTTVEVRFPAEVPSTDDKTT
jgi:two-component system phosphate regulon sensor histidine kinase PhoR